MIMLNYGLTETMGTATWLYGTPAFLQHFLVLFVLVNHAGSHLSCKICECDENLDAHRPTLYVSSVSNELLIVWMLFKWLSDVVKKTAIFMHLCGWEDNILIITNDIYMLLYISYFMSDRAY